MRVVFAIIREHLLPLVPVPFINLSLLESELVRKSLDDVFAPVRILLKSGQKDILLVSVLSESLALDFDSAVVLRNGLCVLDLLLAEQVVNLDVQVKNVIDWRLLFSSKYSVEVDLVGESFVS